MRLIGVVTLGTSASSASVYSIIGSLAFTERLTALTPDSALTAGVFPSASGDRVSVPEFSPKPYSSLVESASTAPEALLAPPGASSSASPV